MKTRSASLSSLPFSCIAVLLCMMGVAVPSMAQRTIQRQRLAERNAPVKPLQINRQSGEAGFEFHYLSEKQSRKGSSETKLSNRTFQEYLIYRMRGYVYHPRLLDFNAQVKLGLMQQSVDRSGNDDEHFSSNSTIGGYDLYLHFLKEHPLSFSLFANKDRRAVMELFTDRQLVETEGYGATVSWKKAPLPMSLSVTHNRMREWGADHWSESRHTVVEYLVRHELERRMSSELRYRYMMYDQEFEADLPQGDIRRETDSRSHDVSFINNYYLSEDHRSFLNSTLRYYDQNGTQDFSTTTWRERLFLHHSDTLDTYYQFSVKDDQFEDAEIRTYQAEAGIEHQLYRSLKTHFDLHGRRTEYDRITEDIYGGTLSLGYRKHTPWGYLSAGYGRTLDWNKRSGRTSRRRIVDEQVVLIDGITIFLDQPAVIPATIVVTDLNGLVTYTENFDYEVIKQGDNYGLRLLLGGSIADGDTVLVDYETEFTSDIEYISDLQHFNIRYDFERYLEGLSLYYRWRELMAHDAPEVEDFSILEYEEWLAGFQYRFGWLTWREEYQEYDSNFSRYDQLTSQLEGSHHLGRGVQLGWHAGMLMIDYKDEDLDRDYSDIYHAGITLSGRLRPQGYWQLEGRARREKGLVDETLFGLVGKIGKRWRKMNLEAGGRLEQRERNESERDRVQFYLEVSRELP